MVQGDQAAMDSAQQEHGVSPSVLRGAGVSKLALIALCALGGTVAGNAIYDSMARSRSADAFMEKTRPSASYLKAMWSPAIDYLRVEQAPYDFYEADRISTSTPLTKGDQCWKVYDAKPRWSQFDYCVAYDMLIRSNASPDQIKAHASQFGYPSAIERKKRGFFLRKSVPLKGQHVAIQRANDVLLAIRIDNR